MPIPELKVTIEEGVPYLIQAAARRWARRILVEHYHCNPDIQGAHALLKHDGTKNSYDFALKIVHSEWRHCIHNATFSHGVDIEEPT